MTQIRSSSGWSLAALMGFATCFVTAPVALAATGETTTMTEAQASVMVVEPVGAGFAFDVLSDAVSAVFLNGEIGDSVSLLMSPRQQSPRSAGNGLRGVVVMASGVYRIDLRTPTSGRLQSLRSGLLRTGGSSILFLAQFN